MNEQVKDLETELGKMLAGMADALGEYAPDSPVQPALYRWWGQPKPRAGMQKLSEVPYRQRFHAVEQAIIEDPPDAVGLIVPEHSEPVEDGLEQVNIVLCDREQNLVGVGVTVERRRGEPPRVERALKADGFSGAAVKCLKRGMMLAHALEGGEDTDDPPP